MRLLSGRAFAESDRAASLRVAILNETAARAYFGTENPIGRKVNFPGQRVEDAYEIVGVIGDARYQNLRTPDRRTVYLPMAQTIDPVTTVILAVRGARDVLSLAPSVRKSAETLIPGGFVTGVGSIEERVQASLVRERLPSMLATFFAGQSRRRRANIAAMTTSPEERQLIRRHNRLLPCRHLVVPAGVDRSYCGGRILRRRTARGAIAISSSRS